MAMQNLKNMSLIFLLRNMQADDMNFRRMIIGLTLGTMKMKQSAMANVRIVMTLTAPEGLNMKGKRKKILNKAPQLFT